MTPSGRSDSTGLPLVSVVMPVHDGARFIDEAVASVLEQTYGDLELVVVDDGSTDATPGLLQAWRRRDTRVRVVTRPQTGGVAHALVEGVGHSTGDLLARLDADDRAAPDRTRRQVEQFRARPGLGLLGTGVCYVDAAGRTFATERGTSGAAAAQGLRGANTFFHSSVMMRRSAYQRAGGYRPQAEPAEDLDLWLRIAEHFEVDNLEEPLTDYRLHGGQSTLRAPSRQALAAIAAHRAADARAAGAPDPLEGVERVDEAFLRTQGVASAETARELVGAHRHVAELCERAGYQTLAAEAWAAARSAAASLSREDEARLVLRRARVHRERGRHLTGRLGQLHALALAPHLLTDLLGRRRSGGA